MKLRPMLRRTGWVLGTAVDTLGMAAGVFGLEAVARLRLWRLSRLVWLPPAWWVAGGFWSIFRRTRRLDRR